MKKFALIVAGGSGKRMKNSSPKQFLELSGKPLLMHTFRVFFEYDSAIDFVLVLPGKSVSEWSALCKKHQFRLEHKVVLGGETRFRSVKNGLDVIGDEGIVFIHDAVRPLVSVETIRRCEETTLKFGNALPVVPVIESVRKAAGTESKAIDRTELYLVQTPQTFRTKLIKDAYSSCTSEIYTDDATVLENAGGKIHLVEGNRENIKITYPQDLRMAESLIVNI